MPTDRLPCSLPVGRVPALSTDATIVHGLPRFTSSRMSLTPGSSGTGSMRSDTSWLRTRFI